MRKKIAAMAAAGLLTVGVLAGCSQQAAEEPETETVQTEVTETTVEEEPTITIGAKASDSVVLQIINGTGKEIAEVYAKGSTEEAYPEAKLASSEAWEDGVIADVYIPAIESTASESEGETDVALASLYDVRLVFADGSSAELYEVTEGDYEELTVKLDGEIAYLTYKNGKAGNAESTLEHQKSVIEAKRAEAEAAAQAEAEARAAAEAQAAAEAEAAAQAAAQEQAYTAPQYDSSSSSSGSGSSGYDYSYDTTAPSGGGSDSQGGGSSGQSEDACVSDLVLN